MLDRYRNDQRIGMISGDNFQFGRSVTSVCYYFTKYTHIWGWATWRRAWSGYDVQASIWPKFLNEGWLEQISPNESEESYWREAFQSVYDGRMDTWDYQWTLHCYSNGRVSVIPNLNLISNIGFGKNATHTFGESICANIPVKEMFFPLRHPNIIRPNPKADAYTANTMFYISYVGQVKKTLRSIISVFLKKK
jgi:hypothetical protein